MLSFIRAISATVIASALCAGVSFAAESSTQAILVYAAPEGRTCADVVRSAGVAEQPTPFDGGQLCAIGAEGVEIARIAAPVLHASRGIAASDDQCVFAFSQIGYAQGLARQISIPGVGSGCLLTQIPAPSDAAAPQKESNK